ncbi:DUF3078 domain-containing protein [Algibacter sp. L4_22]|uniref:DUF3078 domain-containing protein n=1 Tax=Algibacter sp. L4_22 TaxID=2942477 RepID=UPI00201B4CCB|nr:DUF3078 domain-containing protein [Algibacter sp. L4_22]MCL5129572.1 DUF3078 domain-containing protein [Algibacter sp. L4_22]
MKNFFLIIACLLIQCIYAQPDSLFLKVKKQKYEGPQWEKKNKATFDLSQVSFVNWNSGGSNSISGLLGFETSANYSDKYFSWRNDARLRYGINKQQSRELRKTDDLIEINSSMGFKPDVDSNWFYSAQLNFRTQLTNGYKYPNTDDPISRLMAPGYLFLGCGMEYGKRIKQLSFYFSPLTLKETFVLDEDLANAGAFGVTPAVYDSEGELIKEGEQFRREVGILMTNSYEMELAKNINVKNQVSMYSDYINNFGNVDIDWQLDFDFKVNSFVRATLGSHLRYDDDVKTTIETDVDGETEEAGAKVQWKQFLGVGFAVDF